MSFIPGKTLFATQALPVGATSLIALGSQTFTVPMPGAIVGVHAVFDGPLADPGALIISQAWVSSAGVVTLRITNLSATASTTTPTTWLLALVSAS